jgi:hypothetical protein
MNHTAAKNRNVTTTIAIGVLILTLIGSLFYNVVTTRLKTTAEEDLNNERLRSETFLSEKLAFEKENVRLEGDINLLTDSIFLLDARKKLIESQLADALKSADKNRKNSQTIAQLEAQLKSSNAVRQELEKRLSDIAMELASALSSRNSLEDSIARLHASLEQLSSSYEALQHRAMDNVLVMPMKKNGKLTVKSKRVKKFILNAEIPGVVNDLKIDIITPDGSIIVPASNELNVVSEYVTQTGNAFYVAPTTNLPQVKAEITYTPKKKLKAGLYRIIVTNSGSIVGSLQVKLR